MTPFQYYSKALCLWFTNILVALDQLVGAIFGIDPDETLSSYVGKKRDAGRAWAKPIAAFLDWLDPNHTTKYQEPDEGSNSVWVWLKENKPGAKNDEV